MAGEKLIAPMWAFLGVSGEKLWLRIREDATWEFVNDQDDVIEYGTLWVDEKRRDAPLDVSGDTCSWTAPSAATLSTA